MTSIARIRLHDILLERHMTKQQLVQLTGLRPSTVSDLFKPTASRIYLSTVAILCTVLNVSIGELIVLEPTQHGCYTGAMPVQLSSRLLYSD